MTNGPVPPAENTTSDTAAMGAGEPSGRARRLVSTAAQDPSVRWTRAGTALDVKVEVPSALAKTWVYSLRPERTSTRPPQALAAAAAARSSGLPAEHGGAAAAGVDAAPAVTSRPARSVDTAIMCTRMERPKMDVIMDSPRSKKSNAAERRAAIGGRQSPMDI
ncbi:hypothetical protein GCM10027610_014800 [Dactylosporangium cerinum]